jgi:hypothetical protein
LILATLPAAAAGQEIGELQEIQNAPEGQGVFCRIAEFQWTTLEPATITETKTEGIRRFLDTAGLSTILTIITYKGTKASVRVSDARPMFFVRGKGSAEDALIVRLVPKKDSRESYTLSDNASYDNKGGFKSSDIFRLSITPYSKVAFSAIPEKALEPGEYLLTFGNVNVGYGFAVVIRLE